MKTILIITGVTIFAYGFLGEFAFSFNDLFFQCAYAIVSLGGAGLVAVGLID